eukprot:c8524_g1_i2.p1 GENE.c8524_g1_i2~~c8524_g1_i2.p1  ORF type:complete len:377 (-),score=106.60 c8524_g1_i2:130-1260(-)
MELIEPQEQMSSTINVHSIDRRDQNFRLLGINHVIFEGWMFKESKYLKKWKRYYFRLFPTHLMSYKTIEADIMSEAQHEWDLCEFQAIPAPHTRGGAKIIMQHKSHQLDYLLPEPQDDVEHWVTEINKALKHVCAPQSAKHEHSTDQCDNIPTSSTGSRTQARESATPSTSASRSASASIPTASTPPHASTASHTSTPPNVDPLLATVAVTLPATATLTPSALTATATTQAPLVSDETTVLTTKSTEQAHDHQHTNDAQAKTVRSLSSSSSQSVNAATPAVSHLPSQSAAASGTATESAQLQATSKATQAQGQAQALTATASAPTATHNHQHSNEQVAQLDNFMDDDSEYLDIPVATVVLDSTPATRVWLAEVVDE